MQRFLAFLFVLFVAGNAPAQEHGKYAGAVAAVVCIPSHGASATVIWTGPGKTLILGCGHAYEPLPDGKDMLHEPHRILVPVPQTAGAPIKAKITLLRVDFKRDLSLLQLDAGPLPYVAPIAPRGFNPTIDRLLSCGYDGIQFPPHQVPEHILRVDGKIYFTDQPPDHGRSGGGLIDLDRGWLVGVCEGYTFGTPQHPGANSQGMFITLDTIHDFLDGAQTTPIHHQSPVHPIHAPTCPPSV